MCKYVVNPAITGRNYREREKLLRELRRAETKGQDGRAGGGKKMKKREEARVDDVDDGSSTSSEEEIVVSTSL